MATTSPKHTPEQIEEAVAKVRAFYEVGRRSLKERSGRAAYADDEAGKDARAAGLNPDTLRAARRFADPGAATRRGNSPRCSRGSGSSGSPSGRRRSSGS